MTRTAVDESINFSLIDAVETLSRIADLDFEQEVGITREHDLEMQTEIIHYRTIHWLHKNDAEGTVAVVRDTFRVVLKYLQNFYKNQFPTISDEEASEGIKTVMVLVGEAARKLDAHAELFQFKKGVRELKEYKDLQSFYARKIARRVDEGMLGRWILALTEEAHAKKKLGRNKQQGKKPSKETKHVFIDLESLKKDYDYELLLIRKEDGTRFFSPRLLRNIKLVSDFETYFGKKEKNDPLANNLLLRDRNAHLMARDILDSAHTAIREFYKTMQGEMRTEFTMAIHNAIIALSLASHVDSSHKKHRAKWSYQYFEDFLTFFRQALNARDYQKYVVYPPKNSDRAARAKMEALHAICYGFYMAHAGFSELVPTIKGLIQLSLDDPASGLLHERLAQEFAALSELMNKHPSGPLTKLVEQLEEGTYHVFDPLMQHNLPSKLYTMYLGNHCITVVHTSTPTRQEYIHKAQVIEEFRGFLRSLQTARPKKKLLYINFQDSTSWQEHFRVKALESLMEHSDTKEQILVASLPKDTDFYHQMPPYHEEHRARQFLKLFLEQLSNDQSGFSLPKDLRSHVDFAHILSHIHKVFFNERNVLSRQERLDFIEIAYVVFELLCIDAARPDILVMSCKDGVDVGAAAHALLQSALMLAHDPSASPRDYDDLLALLFGPALLIRERLMQSDRFYRFISALKRIESVKEEVGHAVYCDVVHNLFTRFIKQ